MGLHVSTPIIALYVYFTTVVFDGTSPTFIVTLFNYTYSAVFYMSLQLDLQLLKNVTVFLCTK